MFCYKCGKENGDNSKFCLYCGTKLVNGASETPAVPQAQTAPQTAQSGSANPPQQNSSNLKIIIPIVSAVLVLLLAIGAYFIVTNINKSKDADIAVSNNADTSKDKDEESDDTAAGSDSKEAAAVSNSGPVKNANIVVNEIDNSKFPNITMYATVKDETGNVIEKLPANNFKIKESLNSGTSYKELIIKEVRQDLVNVPMSINLVMDESGSMAQNNKISNAKRAASGFLSSIKFDIGDKVEVIGFNNYINVNQAFTNQYSLLEKTINEVEAVDSGTALYDALYTSLVETAKQSGPKCVIAFTDGIENGSVNCTYDDVVTAGKQTGIPIYIIGIGSDCDADGLTRLAGETGGKYYSAQESDLSKKLQDIYKSVYDDQKARYAIQFITSNSSDKSSTRDITLEFSESSGYSGTGQKQYVPVTVMFNSPYMNKDFIFADSSTRRLGPSEVQKLSLVELRLARNEIFARNGREFKDRILAKWFFNKQWYLNIKNKYAPDYFDQNISLNQIEKDNITLIQNAEKILKSGTILPDGNTRKLTDWDVMLDKNSLALAKKQIYQKAGVSEGNSSALSDIEKYNIELINKTINLLPKN